MSLRDARDLARDELTRVRKGASDLLERRRRNRDAPTVNDALQKFFTATTPQRIAAGRFTERTARSTGGMLSVMSLRCSVACRSRR